MPSEYTIILEFNPNKAGLCESIFFRAGGGGGVNLNPRHISERTNLILIEFYAIVK